MPTPEPYTGEFGGTLYEREESAHDNPTPAVRVQASPAAFGVNVAEATQHLGEVSEQAGKELFDRAYAMQELKVHADVNSRLADTTNAMQDKLVQYKSLEGKAAVDALPTLQADLDKIRSDGGTGLSPYGQQLFDGESRNQRGRLGFSAATHAADQNKVYEVGSANATITTAIRGMSLDPSQTAANIAAINTAVDHKSDIMGLPEGDPQRDMARRTAVDTAYQVQIHAMARENPIAATKVYNAAIKSGALFSSDAMALDGTLKSLSATWAGRNNAIETQSGIPAGHATGPAPSADFFSSRGGANLDYKDINPDFGMRLNAIVNAAEQATGSKVEFTSLARTYEQQASLYYNYTHGIDGQGLAAPPGSSLHERGLAADIKDGPALDYIRAHAAEYGLAHLGMDDKGHIQIAGGGGMSLTSRPDTPPASLASPTAANPAGGSGFLGALVHFESGGKAGAVNPIMTSSGHAESFYQITTGTWNEFAAKSGVDLAKYPAPHNAPADVQWQVAQNIPLKRWAPETLAKLSAAGYQFDPNKTLGENVAAHGGARPTGGENATDTSGSTVFHATATPEDAADRPLRDKIADALARTNAIPELANNPEAQEQTVKAVEALDAQEKRIQADTNRRDMQTVSGAMWGGGNNQKLPSTLGELRQTSPEVGQAIDRLIHNDPEKVMSITRELNKNAKGDVPETPERMVRAAQLKGMATSDPEGFAKQDIMATDLPMADKKQLLDLQVKGQGKAPADPNVAAAFRQPGIADQLQNLGLKPKTQEYNLLAAEVGDEMKQFQTDNKRPPNSAEREEIVTRILQDKALHDADQGSRSFFSIFGPGYGSSDADKAKTDWMDNAREQVKTERGYTPTDMELTRAWDANEYQKKYGGAKKSGGDNSAALKKASTISTGSIQLGTPGGKGIPISGEQ